MKHEIDFVPAVKPKANKRVAIVGAGPAGLSAAWELALEGFEVVVFESLPVAGGMMRVAIPEYRLPHKMVEHEVENIRRLGVTINLNSPVRSIDALIKDGYHAVFIACGTHRGVKMEIPGENLDGVYDAIDFLRNVNLGLDIPVGRKVSVIGGGNSAIDAARVALRLGAEEVNIFYRRTRQDMPALAEEIEAAEKEGIRIHPLTLPTRFIGSGDKVKAVELVRLEPAEFDSSGRRICNPKPNTEFTVETDMVIEAIGQRPDVTFLTGSQLGLTSTGLIKVDARTLATEIPGVFAGGDAVTGPKTVIEAVAAGKRAARSIKNYLEGRPLTSAPANHDLAAIPVPATLPAKDQLQPTGRVKINEITVSERRNTFREVVLPYTTEDAMKEASRCLRCDLQEESA